MCSSTTSIRIAAASNRNSSPWSEPRLIEIRAPMGVPSDDVVLIQMPKRSGEPTVVTVNCPDKHGLGCDLCRILLEFGLHINRADFSTDGRWCYVIFWVVPHLNSNRTDWESLNNRLSSVCPSCLGSYYFKPQESASFSHSSIYMLKLCCVEDQRGLLHDVTKVLTELELTIQRVKVMTTPDGGVLDLFFVTDAMGLLHTKKRQDETQNHLMTVLGKHCISCEVQLARPEYESSKGFTSLPDIVAEELFSCELSGSGNTICSRELGQDSTTLKKTSVIVDNLMSPAHTLLQIQCPDQKGLFYDILRTSKDLNIQIAYGRFSPSAGGSCNIDLFIQQAEGRKILDPKEQAALCSRLKEEMVHPLRVTITNRGPDTELLVANPVELSGKGRPRVFYDVTFALKTLGICIFLAEICRHTSTDHQWEVYRFLLDESREFPLSSAQARSKIVNRVKKILMGW